MHKGGGTDGKVYIRYIHIILIRGLRARMTQTGRNCNRNHTGRD